MSASVLGFLHGEIVVSVEQRLSVIPTLRSRSFRTNPRRQRRVRLLPKLIQISTLAVAGCMRCSLLRTPAALLAKRTVIDLGAVLPSHLRVKAMEPVHVPIEAVAVQQLQDVFDSRLRWVIRSDPDTFLLTTSPDEVHPRLLEQRHTDMGEGDHWEMKMSRAKFARFRLSFFTDDVTDPRSQRPLDCVDKRIELLVCSLWSGIPWKGGGYEVFPIDSS